MTKGIKISINTIDIFTKVCYNESKLENKTNILTNKKQKQGKTKMPQTEDIQLPSEVVDSDWKDDIDYEPYEDEKAYISPDSIKRETIAKIKKSPIKLSIRNMVDWNKISEQMSA